MISIIITPTALVRMKRISQQHDSVTEYYLADVILSSPIHVLPQQTQFLAISSKNR